MLSTRKRNWFTLVNPNGCIYNKVYSRANLAKESFVLNKTVNSKPIKIRRVGNRSELSALSFLDHGSGDLLVAGCDDGTLRLLNVHDAQTPRRKQWSAHANRSIHTVAVSGSKIVTGANDTCLKLWSPERDNEIRLFSDHEGWIACASFDSMGTIIASAGQDSKLNLWHPDVLQPIFSVNTDQVLSSVCFVGDGSSNLLLMTSETHWRLLDVRMHRSYLSVVQKKTQSDQGGFDHNRHNLIPHEQQQQHLRRPSLTTVSDIESMTVQKMSITTNSSAVTTGTASSFDRKHGIFRKNFQGHLEKIVDVNMIADRSSVVTTDVNGVIKVWDLHTGEGVRTMAREAAADVGYGDESLSICKTATSLHGKVIISGGHDGKLCIWESETEDIHSRASLPLAELQCGNFGIRAVAANTNCTNIVASDSSGALFGVSACSQL
eukprot:m.179945 g.179945  ORF g.179945 m.179945 type:complete len:435 (+) comp31996_c0_seq1:239-1543(+)